MREVKLVVAPHIKSPYSVSQAAFCWVSPKQKSGEYVQISKFTGCKDYLHDALYTHVMRGKVSLSTNSHGYKPSESPNMDMKRLRLLMCCRQTTKKEQIYSGKRLLNILEGKLGWRKTSIRKVTHPVEKNTFMLIGSKCWMQAPFFLSILTLLMRASAENDALTASTWEESKKEMLKWSGRDSGHIHSVIDKIYPVLLYRRKFMKDLPKETIWPKKASFGSFHNSAGFVSLCGLRSYDPLINDSMKSLMEEHKLV